MKRTTYIFITLIAAIATSHVAFAQVPKGYYSSLNGKKGAELKSAVYEIIKDAKVLDYGSGTEKTWGGFYSTDRTADNKVIDRYSNDVRYFEKKGASVGGMNIEHSFPKSWWGGSTNQAYKDLYNLMPCEQKINNSKSNYPMGEVTNATTDNGCTKVGKGSNGYQLWEPADKWKGDFARGYMYMATAYQNLSWTGTQALQILQNNKYPTLQPWAYTLYIKWAKNDVPDEIEIARNAEVAKIQGNRNPFVDFPNLMEYIWGDSIDYAFNTAKTKKTISYDDDGTITPTEEDIYDFNVKKGNGGWETTNISIPTGVNSIWSFDTTYGWKGTAFYGSAKAAEAILYTPEIDLKEYTGIKMNFNHAVNFAKSPTPADILSVEVLCEGKTTVLQDVVWPTGDSWKFNNSGVISLEQFAGKKIKIGFRYTSTDAQACTWEIQTLNVKGKKTVTDITTPTVEKPARPDFSRPYEAFGIDGTRLNGINDKGIVIIRQDGHTWKTTRK